MFKFVGSMIGSYSPVTPPADVTSYEVDETAMVVGQVAKFTAGKLKHATDDNIPAVILLEAGADGDEVRCEWITPGAIYKTTCLEGTASSVALGSSYEIDSTYLGVNQGAGGPITVIKIDGTDLYVVFNACLLMGGTTRT